MDINIEITMKEEEYHQPKSSHFTSPYLTQTMNIVTEGTIVNCFTSKHYPLNIISTQQTTL